MTPGNYWAHLNLHSIQLLNSDQEPLGVVWLEDSMANVGWKTNTQHSGWTSSAAHAVAVVDTLMGAMDFPSEPEDSDSGVSEDKDDRFSMLEMDWAIDASSVTGGRWVRKGDRNGYTRVSELMAPQGSAGEVWWDTSCARWRAWCITPEGSHLRPHEGWAHSLPAATQAVEVLVVSSLAFWDADQAPPKSLGNREPTPELSDRFATLEIQE